MPAKAAADGTLIDAKGMTLYTFDRDAGSKTACNGPCATNWPPLMAGADAKAAGDWTVITRDDGSRSGRTRASRCTRGRRTPSRATRPATTSITCGIQQRSNRARTPDRRAATRAGPARRAGLRRDAVPAVPHANPIPRKPRGCPHRHWPTRRCRSRTCSRPSRACAVMRAC